MSHLKARKQYVQKKITCLSISARVTAIATAMVVHAHLKMYPLKEAEGLDLPKKHLKNLQKSQKRQLTQ